MRLFPLVLLPLLVAACGSRTPEVELDLVSNPEGARVFLSRRGEKAYQGKLGPLKGDVKDKDVLEEFLLIGTSPLTYTTPLRVTESDATARCGVEVELMEVGSRDHGSSLTGTGFVPSTCMLGMEGGSR